MLIMAVTRLYEYKRYNDLFYLKFELYQNHLQRCPPFKYNDDPPEPHDCKMAWDFTGAPEWKRNVFTKLINVRFDQSVVLSKFDGKK